MRRGPIWSVFATALAVTVTGAAAAAPARADSTPAEIPVTSVHGVQNGVTYSARVAPDGGSVVTTLESGTFTVSSDATSIVLADAAGTPVGVVPLTFTAAGRNISLTPSIERGGTTMTLRPSAGPLHDIDAQETWNQQVQRGVYGALIGGAIGGLIGVPFWWLVLPPLIGIAIGAGIGFLAAGGQPMIDAGIAYFTGQP